MDIIFHLFEPIRCAHSTYNQIRALFGLALCMQRDHVMTREEYGLAYERGFDLTVRFLLSRGGYPNDRVAEAAQAAWSRGWEKLSQLRNPDLVVTWVNTIALNSYRKCLRRELLFEILPELTSKAGIDMAAIDVGRILKNCRPSVRKLLEQQLKGATVEEIARQHGITETAARIRLLRARRVARRRAEIRSTRALEPRVAA